VDSAEGGGGGGGGGGAGADPDDPIRPCLLCLEINMSFVTTRGASLRFFWFVFSDFEIDVVTILNGKNEADCKKVDIGERADEEH
jgi:hypothetical protein